MTEPAADDDWTPPIPLADDLDEPTEYPVPDLPDDNPAWDLERQVAKRMGTLRMPTQAREAVTGLAMSPAVNGKLTKRDLDYLDQQIFDMRVRGISVYEIARRLGNGMSPEMVTQRLQVAIDRIDRISVTEMRALQVARLEGLVNMLWTEAEQYSNIEAADKLIKTLERINRMWELESEKMTVEVTVINKAQTDVVLGIVAMLIEKFRPLLERSEDNTPDIIDGAVLNVLDAAEEMLRESQKPVPYDPKEGRLMAAGEIEGNR